MSSIDEILDAMAKLKREYEQPPSHIELHPDDIQALSDDIQALSDEYGMAASELSVNRFYGIQVSPNPLVERGTFREHHTWRP